MFTIELLYKSILLVVAFLFSAFASCVQAGEVKEFVMGHARKNGKELYNEKIEITKDSQAVLNSKTEFFSPEGKRLAVVTSKASKSRYLPDVDFNDFRDGYEYSVRHKDDNILELREKESATAPWKTQPVAIKNNMILIQSVADFARDNIADLRAGKKVKASFLVPSKSTDFSLQIEQDPHSPFKPEAKTIDLRMESSNWLLRNTVFPAFSLTYDIEKQRVTKFTGVSTIMAELGIVEVTYH